MNTYLYENADLETRDAEGAARGGTHTYEVAVENFSESLGRQFDREEIGRWAWRFHKDRECDRFALADRAAGWFKDKTSVGGNRTRTRR